MPTTMISVPKITLPPSSVTWARKIAIVPPPSCCAASIDAARMIAIIAMLATIRDGQAVGGQHAGRQDRLVEAGRRQDRLDDRLEEARGDEGDADPQRRGEDARDRGEDLVEHRRRRAGDRFDPEDLKRGDRDRNDDQRIDEHAGRLGEARPRRARRGARRNGRRDRCAPCRRCRRCRSGPAARRRWPRSARSRRAAGRSARRSGRRRRSAPAPISRGRKAKISVTSSLIGARICADAEEAAARP